MSKLNIGIIGLGQMGLLHMMNCLHMDDAKVVAASDKSKSALSKAASLRVKNLYIDYQELLRKESDRLDVVVISLPNFLHLESVRMALEAKVNVFLEKPLATNLDEGREIVRAVEKNGRELMLGHCMRFVDAIEKMKATADEGRLGNLEIITIESIQNGPLSHGRFPKPISEWWFDPKKSGGGALLDIGYHLIDLFRFFAGDAKVLFSCLDYKYNLPVEDGATVVLNSNGSSTRGVINVGWFEKTIFPRFNFRLILHGMADFMSTDQLIPRNIYAHAVKEGLSNFMRRVAGKPIRPLSYTYYYEPYYREIEVFLNCLRQDLASPIPVTDGLKTMEVIHEAYKASDERSIGREIGTER